MKSPHRYKAIREAIGLIVIVSGPLDVFVGFKLAQEDWVWASVGLVLATLLSWGYWKAYALWMECLNASERR